MVPFAEQELLGTRSSLKPSARKPSVIPSSREPRPRSGLPRAVGETVAMPSPRAAGRQPEIK
jgi:hypothetical protein